MRPLRILKIAWVSFWSVCVGLVALIGILLYGAHYLSDPTRGEFLRNLVFDERAFEVTVDLVVEGEPLTITRTVNCVPYLSGVELKISESWKPSLESFGERLNSGGVVLVVAPPLCGVAELSFRENSKPLPIPDEYMPLIRWVDDPDRPTVIEDYIAREYFVRPNARVRYQGMSARAVPYQSSAMELERLDWFSAGRSNAFRPRDSEGAYGYVVWPIFEHEWSTDEAINDEIRSIDRTSEISLPLARRLMEKFSPQIHYDWIDRGQGLVPGPGPIDYRSSLRMKRDLSQIMPLFFRDGAFEPNEEERGYLVLYPMASNPPRGDGPLKMKLRINGQTVSVEFAGFTGATTIYVPETKTIYQLVPLWKHVPSTAER